ncbi:neo-calmodulin-like [Mercenaria mercenaria]|uniref:neo-calmodulin-like n=1 Tax=Mercenaria mercenaria TaxID=6596 RepID=UPI001E1D9FD3|nr:neo-calmodulin-like [Mercenaria mercenaria]
MASKSKSKSKSTAVEMSGPGSKQFEKDIKDMFKLFDKDGDKSLSTEEISKALKSMGVCLTYKEIQVALKDIGKNKHGKIEFKEFREFLIRQYKSKSLEAQARESFRIFDRDGNGTIDRKELKHAMKMLGEELSDEEVEQMMKEADENGDGKINFEEFLRLWKILNGEEGE